MLVSVGPMGQLNWGYAGGAAFSADSRHVGYVGTNGSGTVRDHNSPTSVVMATNGTAPSLSVDGASVAFLARQGNPARTNVLVHDRSTGLTTLASGATDGSTANGDCTTPLLSADGRYVVFASKASNLVPNDTNRASDIFVRAVRKVISKLNSIGPGEAELRQKSGGRPLVLALL